MFYFNLTLHEKCIYPFPQTIFPKNCLSRRRKKVILDLIPALLTTHNSNKRSLANIQTDNCKNALLHQLCKVDE